MSDDAYEYAHDYDYKYYYYYNQLIIRSVPWYTWAGPLIAVMIVAIIVGLLVHYRRILRSRNSEVDGVSTYPVSMKKVEMAPKT
mmetsp:Transcript_24857/g.36477  ORF Transcript_24857/g.36477 Transcript_24857/m.36477 type:complete len:84 (+) Transcript_24857:171-422(+)|eukprot:CAMPEP_0195529158 /NCGR_PEP_ID=MMETSP0794_2-20130614/31600_1 /TAXON_ID=515487 /ORGANISM="Stephanopyxis turris, Strain CCMP 815" /LENGTH=83 /DNA_ID=CAMNT_0040660417 /DNA_START=169 /DNA_END=420 /DNA_ORIENTATION=+